MDRGLDLGGVTNDKFAMFLYSSNYYRVSGYGRCFCEAGADKYIAGTSAAHSTAIRRSDSIDYTMHVAERMQISQYPDDEALTTEARAMFSDMQSKDRIRRSRCWAQFSSLALLHPLLK